MSAESIRSLAENNDEFSHQHPPSFRFADFPNIKANMIISCMDPRANPNEFWNFNEGSDQKPGVIRNAGGRATEDTLRSIRALAAIMGYGKNTVGAVAVIHHLDCGLRNFSNEQVRELLKERVGLEGERAQEVDRMDFGSWTDATSAEASVQEDMAIIKNDPYLPKDLEVIGYVYDVFTGKTTEVGVM